MTPAGRYSLYGLSLDSPLVLPCRGANGQRGAPRVRLKSGKAARFERLRSAFPRQPGCKQWFRYRRLRDGAAYLRWEGLFEFLVSANGRHIEYRSLARTAHETFATYLLGQVLSFSLLAFGDEPLHGTAVVVKGKAVAFLGDCGYGKSTLGAAFLRRGHSLLTDDLLALKPDGAGYAAHPGIPRIKLFPGVSRRVLRVGDGTPVNPGTSKLILPLGSDQACPNQVPLAALYVLAAPARRLGRVRIKALSPATALVELVRNTFNTVIIDRARLASQFKFVSRLVAGVPVKRLSYPRRLSELPAVCDAVLADLAG